MRGKEGGCCPDTLCDTWAIPRHVTVVSHHQASCGCREAQQAPSDHPVWFPRRWQVNAAEAHPAKHPSPEGEHLSMGHSESNALSLCWCRLGRGPSFSVWPWLEPLGACSGHSMPQHGLATCCDLSRAVISCNAMCIIAAASGHLLLLWLSGSGCRHQSLMTARRTLDAMQWVVSAQKLIVSAASAHHIFIKTSSLHCFFGWVETYK